MKRLLVFALFSMALLKGASPCGDSAHVCEVHAKVQGGSISLADTSQATVVMPVGTRVRWFVSGAASFSVIFDSGSSSVGGGKRFNGDAQHPATVILSAASKTEGDHYLISAVDEAGKSHVLDPKVVVNP